MTKTTFDAAGSLRAAGAKLAVVLCLATTAWGEPAAASPRAQCDVELMVLGVAQDGGLPQIGHSDDPAWGDAALSRHATSLALIDRRAGTRFLFEATPDIRIQLRLLDEHMDTIRPGLHLDGIFLTHAHIGHYTGLMMLGREAAGATEVPVFAMPRMAAFLASNGPWDQLVRLQNITIRNLYDGEAVAVGEDVSVRPFRVPHRDEYSETVGYVVRGPTSSALFIPDIDDWDRLGSEFGVTIEDLIKSVDVAYLDATFYNDNELPGVDMSVIPHPRVLASMNRFAALADADRRKVRFIHMNHTNPLLVDASPAARAVSSAGFIVAREGETTCLGVSR